MLESRKYIYRRILQQLLSSVVLLSGVAHVHACEFAVPLIFNQVVEGVYVHEGVHEDITKRNCGDIANVGFVVGSVSVAVIDPGGSPAIARDIQSAITRVTDLPISHVVITHLHPDHMLGAAHIVPDVDVVAHKHYPRALAQRGQFYLDRYAAQLFDKDDSNTLATPTLLVENQTTLNLGGRELLLTAHQTAHTDNDLSILDIKTGTLWTGDLLFHDRIPSLDGSITGWLAVMDELNDLHPTLVVPGHGSVSTWESIAPKQKQYLEVIRDEIRLIIAKNGRLSDAVDLVGLSEQQKWQLFSAFHAGNITKAFTELEWE